MSFSEEQISLIRDNSVVIVYPEGDDPDIIKAARMAVDKGVASPVLLGSEDDIRKAAQEADTDLNGIKIIDPSSSEKLDNYADEFAKITSLPATTGRVLLKRPLYFGAMMARMHDADCICSGIRTETAEVVAAYKMILGMREGIQVPSCFTIIEAENFNGTQGNLVAVSDTAINADPTSEELADIAIASAQTANELLGWEPRVALLSFSTLTSSKHPNAQKVTNAVEIAKNRRPDLNIDGEMQLDAALLPSVAKRKFGRESEVAGKANVLIFPNLDAGNIGVKLLRVIGGVKASGGLLQGFNMPVGDLSRGADANRILRNSVLLIRIAQNRKDKLS